MKIRIDFKMLYKIFSAILLIAILSISGYSQQPKYTKKYFVSYHDTSLFKPMIPKDNGFVRTFIVSGFDIWDTDEKNTTHVTGGIPSALICIEGKYENKKRNGLFTYYLIDSFDHTKRYKLYEQTFVNDKLTGQWKHFNLKGTVIRYQTYKNDSLNGISRDYWIDGKTIMDEREYFNGTNKFIGRKYSNTGILMQEMTIENGVLNGLGKKYYEDGKVQEEVHFKNGEFDKTRKYYHPNGQLWIQQDYKDGLHWNVIANYDEKGNKRNPGTLKNGNGTIIFYNDDGTIRETITYKNGVEQ